MLVKLQILLVSVVSVRLGFFFTAAGFCPHADEEQIDMAATSTIASDSMSALPGPSMPKSMCISHIILITTFLFWSEENDSIFEAMHLFFSLNREKVC